MVIDIYKNISPDIAFTQSQDDASAMLRYMPGNLYKIAYDGSEPASLNRMLALGRVLALK